MQRERCLRRSAVLTLLVGALVCNGCSGDQSASGGATAEPSADDSSAYRRVDLHELPQKLPCSSLGDMVMKTRGEPAQSRRVEDALDVVGFTPGPIDDVWDEGSTAALHGFQNTYGLAITDSPDAASAAALAALFVVLDDGTQLFTVSTGYVRSASRDAIELNMGDRTGKFTTSGRTRFLGGAWRSAPFDALQGHCVSVYAHAKSNAAYKVTFGRGASFVDPG